MKTAKEEWCVYVLRCRNDYLYVGITNDLDRRMEAHANGTGSKFVRSWMPFELVKVLPCASGREARTLEYKLKRMKRDKKIGTLGLAAMTADKKKGRII